VVAADRSGHLGGSQRALAIDVLGAANVVTWVSAFDDGTPPAVAIVGVDSSVSQAPLP
jgi:hypothetical protein